MRFRPACLLHPAAVDIFDFTRLANQYPTPETAAPCLSRHKCRPREQKATLPKNKKLYHLPWLTGNAHVTLSSGDF